MTEIKKSLAGDTVTSTASIAVTLDFTRRQKLVAVRLEGVILNEHVPALRDFLENVTYFPGNKWTLQLEHLEVMSVRALRVLAKFARVIRRHGYAVEIAGIRSTMLATLLDLNLYKHFAWDAFKRRSAAPKVSLPASGLPLPVLRRERFIQSALYPTG